MSSNNRVVWSEGLFLRPQHFQAAERYLLFQDADFEYRRIRLNLLRATGDLENWALAGPASTPTSK